MSGYRCSNGVTGCGLTEPHRHHGDGAGTYPGETPPPIEMPSRQFDKMTLDVLLDELVACSMDLGALNARYGITALAGRVANLKREVLVRAGPQVTPR